MTEYTERDHAEMLIKILKMDNTCNECPIRVFKRINSVYFIGCERDLKLKHLCCGFVGITDAPETRYCPCWELGPEEAVKRTWIALEDKGYI